MAEPTAATILIVDDEASLRETIEAYDKHRAKVQPYARQRGEDE